MLNILPARLDHIPLLAPRLREGDRLEVAALGASPEDALSAALGASSGAWFALFNDEPLAMYGIVVPAVLGAQSAVLWCLTCEAVNRHRKLFLRESKAFVDAVQQTYPTLTAFVQKEYTATVNWATRWLGFTVTHEIVVHGVDCLACRRERTWALKQ